MGGDRPPDRFSRKLVPLPRLTPIVGYAGCGVVAYGVTGHIA